MAKKEETKQAGLGAFAKAKAAAVQRQSSIRIQGVRHRATGKNGNFVVIGCICVQEEGCPCVGPFIWLNPRDVLDQGDTGRWRDGEQISWFDVDPDTSLHIETTSKVPARGYALGVALAEAAKERGNGSVMKNGAAPGWVKGKAINLAATLAFAAGYWVGENVVDPDGDLSDDAADWLHDTFGDAPGWLQDLF